MTTFSKIGIIGSGKMGSDLFNYLSDFSFQLIWFTRNPDHKEILKNTYRKKIKRQLKHGIINQKAYELKEKYQITADLQQFSDCDLIIESVIESIDVKQQIFQQLDTIAKPSCVLASNSSSILPSEIAENSKHKNRIMGLHFFYPIAFKNVVEIVSSEDTDEISLEKIRLFLNQIKRFYLEQNERNAFILNRFLLQLQIKAYDLLKDKSLGFKQFDNVSKQLIPEFGLFEVMDHVGHNTMYQAILNYSRVDHDKRKYEPLLEELQTRKTGADKNLKKLFYEDDFENTDVDENIKSEILKQLKNTAEEHMNRFTKDYELNPYNLKKGMEEFCGLQL